MRVNRNFLIDSGQGKNKAFFSKEYVKKFSLKKLLLPKIFIVSFI